jgi:hypothetical protein
MMMFYPGIHWDSQTNKARRCSEHQQADYNGSTSTVEATEKVAPPAVEVNPKQPLFVVGDSEAKLSLAYAKAQGYRLILDGDGEAEVTNGDGQSYYILNFECNCPDKRHRKGTYFGRCKHEIWIGQMRPCEMCGSVMTLGEFKTAFGETLMRFECPACGNARDSDLVREERKAMREGGPQDERLMPEGRCRQAIAWLEKKGIARYVWFAVRQSPDLVPVMVRLLAEAGQGELADTIAKAFPIAVEPPSPEKLMRERLLKAKAALIKMPKGQSLFSGVLEHLDVKRLEDIPAEKLPDVLSLCEQLNLSAAN